MVDLMMINIGQIDNKWFVVVNSWSISHQYDHIGALMVMLTNINSHSQPLTTNI